MGGTYPRDFNVDAATLASAVEALIEKRRELKRALEENANNIDAQVRFVASPEAEKKRKQEEYEAERKRVASTMLASV